MQVAFIEPADPRWTATLDHLPHDIYHLPGYTAFSAKHSGGKACAFLGRHDDNILFIPLVLRTMPGNLNTPPHWQDATSPYGYASPLTVAGKSVRSEAELWRAFSNSCREQAIVSVFLRFHPLLPMPAACQEIGMVVEEGETVYIDLSVPDEEISRQIRDNHRRGIRKLRNEGFRTVIDDWSGLSQFTALYRETMLRAGAVEEYLFSDGYFHDLLALNDGTIHLCTVKAPDGTMAAAGLFFCYGGIVQFHLSGTAASYLLLSPTKLMFAEMCRWSKEHGCKLLHLGGGVGCQKDSLFNFKAGFSNCRARYHSLRVVCSPDSYAQLTGQSTDLMERVTDYRGFFPAYRQTRFA